MSTKRMLIDASHPEETRVVIARGNRLEDIDVEAEARRQLKGNIYLAKVTRVEPSLQACFVEYGGNRHGFLAFSEIHPDYFQIPIADREALVAEQREHEAEEGHDDEAEAETGEGVEVVGGDDDDDVQAPRPINLKRHYKIQEVIKRRQILLIQVVKEERGNKGAALTTYLSLAGRYCVLMPNTARGGGVSRKISSGTDRKKLKKILSELDIPQGMAVIVRTAGSKRTKAEIKRDYDYLMRLWHQVRETTLTSIAPCLVHEEGDIVKRAIRDLYAKDIDEVIVEGNDAYRQAKDFMKLMMPSHAKKVQPYADEAMPLLQRYQVENQLDAIHSPEVQLRSGGYIVINPTEALVSIDVNSGRATKERNIEETALKTNLEAADEIARQLRLRDLAGLVVIDFIDMEVNRNQSKVERALKDAMRSDRARIQIGRISPFGLLELSRQRLRPSLLETSSQPCPHCGGTGIRRSTDSSALQILRVLEEEGMRRRSSAVTLHLATDVALYLFNHKRAAIAEMEAKYEFQIHLESDDSLIPPDHKMDRVRIPGVKDQDDEKEDASRDNRPDARNDARPDARNENRGDDGEEEGGRKRRRRRSRRRKRGGEDRDDIQTQSDTDIQGDSVETADGADRDTDTTGVVDADGNAGDGDEEGGRKRRRRGRRGGRRRRRGNEGETTAAAEDVDTENTGETDAPAPETEEPVVQAAAESAVSDVVTAEPAVDAETVEEKPARPARRRRTTKKKDADADTSDTPATNASATNAGATNHASEAVASDEGSVEEKPKPKRTRTRKPKKADTGVDAEVAVVDAPASQAKPADDPEPKQGPAEDIAVPAAAAKTEVIDLDSKPTEKPRKGWWSKLLD